MTVHVGEPVVRFQVDISFDLGVPQRVKFIIPNALQICRQRTRSTGSSEHIAAIVVGESKSSVIFFKGSNTPKIRKAKIGRLLSQYSAVGSYCSERSSVIVLLVI